jgi:epoxyqueuosine reductase QueG
MESLTARVKQLARDHGADLVGVASAVEMPEHGEAITRILPEASRVIVVAARHSLSAISSKNNEVRQYDTIHTYDETARACHQVARLLEDEGFKAVAVPAFIPLDMGVGKNGMRGEISWRQAGYLGGLGSYGENGLLVTPEYGAAVRLAGVVTNAELTPDSILEKDACDHCMACVEACPTKALSGGGKIDKKKCGDHIFRYGFRYFQSFCADLFDGEEKARSVINGPGLKELWQNFMTGNYYYCFRCQDRCHLAGPSE